MRISSKQKCSHNVAIFVIQNIFGPIQGVGDLSTLILTCDSLCKNEQKKMFNWKKKQSYKILNICKCWKEKQISKLLCNKQQLY